MIGCKKREPGAPSFFVGGGRKGKSEEEMPMWRPPPAPSRAYTSWEEGTALAREGENYSIYLISKGLRPFGTLTGRKMRGEFFFVVIGTFKGCPLSHGYAVTAPPRGEPRLTSPYGGGAAGGGGRGVVGGLSGGNKIPAGEAQRNFPVLRGHGP